MPPSDSAKGNDSPEQTPPTNVSRADADACSELLGVQTSKIRVIEAGKDITISGNQPIAIKVTGNRTKVTMNIVVDDGQTLPGLCVYAMGNQPDVTINLGLTLGGLYYRGAGNQSRAVVQVSQIGSLLKSFSADLMGNQARLIVWGNGKHICPATQLSGNSPSVTCTAN